MPIPIIHQPWTLVDASVSPSLFAWVSGSLSDANPTIGNGVLQLRYQRSPGQYRFNLALTIGSTTTLGTDSHGILGWFFQFPAWLHSDQATVGNFWAVAAVARQASTGNATAGAGLISNLSEGSPNAVVSMQVAVGTNWADATHPWSWAAGDSLVVTGFGEGFDN
jgi:hypothetical protein